MKILTAAQIKAWDQFTIENEPIASIDLMERAAKACVEWINQQKLQRHFFSIYCGKGNNGGDGLAIARLLTQQGIHVQVYILEFGKLGTNDFQQNLQRLRDLPVSIQFIEKKEHFPVIETSSIVIDALFGSGLSKPLDGFSAALVQHINHSKARVISIDLPSGLFMDRSSKEYTVVHADDTLTFQTQKLALLIAENFPFIGAVHILDIKLHPLYLQAIHDDFIWIDIDFIKSIYKPRNRFAHKGHFGHALVIGGSYGKIGAVLLATKACLKAGAGLTTSFVPRCGNMVLQAGAPEAMVVTDDAEEMITGLPQQMERFSVIGIGPGLGTHEKTQLTILNLLSQYKKPMVIDADGLNILALHKDSLSSLPPHSILTPHPKEFDRLFGEHENDFNRLTTAKKKAKEFQLYIVLKGHHTLIASPNGKAYFNSTGNAGLAKGGSGDVLTGMITALVAQGYISEHATILGVYLHGLSADKAAQALSIETILASDIITFLPHAYKELI